MRASGLGQGRGRGQAGGKLAGLPAGWRTRLATLPRNKAPTGASASTGTGPSHGLTSTQTCMPSSREPQRPAQSPSRPRNTPLSPPPPSHNRRWTPWQRGLHGARTHSSPPPALPLFPHLRVQVGPLEDGRDVVRDGQRQRVHADDALPRRVGVQQRSLRAGGRSRTHEKGGGAGEERRGTRQAMCMGGGWAPQHRCRGRDGAQADGAERLQSPQRARTTHSCCWALLPCRPSPPPARITAPPLNPRPWGWVACPIHQSGAAHALSAADRAVPTPVPPALPCARPPLCFGAPHWRRTCTYASLPGVSFSVRFRRASSALSQSTAGR